MKIIIVGGGKVGVTLAESLRAEDHDIAIVDPDGDVIEYVSTEYDILGIQGSGVCCGDLREAGAERADLLIATSSLDELNILSCVIASRMGTHRCIARVRDPNLTGQLPFMRDKLGLSAMVNPELYAAGEISRIVRMPSAIRVDSFAKGRIDLAEIKVEAESRLCGLKLSMLPSIFKSKLLICAVNRDNDVIIPGGDFELKAGDKIHVTAPHADLASFFKELGMYNQKIRNVMLVGGGRIAYYLTKQLLDSGISVKIIEMDHDRCLELSSAFPKAKIICADGTDQDILISEGLSTADAFVALTGVDEENIILSMYAKQQGAAKVITKINKPTLKQMTESVGLDSLISPKMLTADMITQYVRAVQNSGGSSISTLYKLLDGQVEAIEFVAREGSRVLDVPLFHLQLKPNLLIAGIIRGGKVIIPSGRDCIEAEDSVIVVTANRYFMDLDEILA
ncbi:MAG: Trk system potassium transporter TrkA [Ruminococcaceae bacterium]|nr:Trk system potassium transporter TrkA [Oscillospiraceae bacterium]